MRYFGLVQASALGCLSLRPASPQSIEQSWSPVLHLLACLRLFDYDLDTPVLLPACRVI